MRAFLPSKFGEPSTKSVTEKRFDATTSAKVLGTSILPDSPRSVVAQGGSRKAVISWLPPVNAAGISGWRVYKHTESNLVLAITNPETTWAEVAIDSGASPPVTNLFVSAVTVRGLESPKVPVQAQAAAEASAPTDPTPPPGATNYDTRYSYKKEIPL